MSAAGSSRWKYKTATVSAGDNTVEVRELTAGERIEFAKVSRVMKATKDKGEQVEEFSALRLVAKAGIVPPLEDADLDAMPADLYGAAAAKILELSGLDGEKGEKKEQAQTS